MSGDSRVVSITIFVICKTFREIDAKSDKGSKEVVDTRDKVRLFCVLFIYFSFIYLFMTS